VVTILLALLSSALFGAGVALQQRPASEVPMELAARPGLLIRVAQQPAWVVGVVAEIAGFVLQVIALRHGSLVVVQPLLTTSLLFTIALAGRWTESTVRAGEWMAVVAVVAGLAIFLIVASPSEESSGLADASDWIITGLSIGAVVGLLLWVGLRASGRRRAAALGLAAGLGDAIMAVLTKAFAHVTDHGAVAALTSWVPYALCAAGLTAMLLTQTAYQAGLPKVSLPIITVADPLVSCGIGVALFGEALHLQGIRGPIVVVSIAIMAAGLMVLSRSSVAATPEPVGSAP
jgi:drug/metabolite transporter (DMT)-like permease